MRLCEHCVYPLCDFCKHYDFNANAAGAYTGDGWCRLHQRKEEPDSQCDDFDCGMPARAALGSSTGEER